jgi:hypothetical protein
MHAVILARLAENTDFEGVVAKQQAELELNPDVAHPFNRLVPSQANPEAEVFRAA